MSDTHTAFQTMADVKAYMNELSEATNKEIAEAALELGIKLSPKGKKEDLIYKFTAALKETLPAKQKYPRFSHKECGHPLTPHARAECRKAMRELPQDASDVN